MHNEELRLISRIRQVAHVHRDLQFRLVALYQCVLTICVGARVEMLIMVIYTQLH